MHKNPFTPSFSTHPDFFYGRKRLIADFDRALQTEGSAERYFILTGTRGCGKTSLLHQYALVARQNDWDAIETTSVDALPMLMHYAELDRSSAKSIRLKPELSAGTLSASLGEVSSSQTSQGSVSLLSSKLIERLSSLHMRRGLAIFIDEAQKIAREDMVRVGNAVQQAKSEGLPIALVLAGLPNAYNRIRSFEDCTFLRRMERVMLWNMTVPETLECLGSLFAKVPEISVSHEQLREIGQFTGGHPYLMQLIGSNIYETIESAYSPRAGMVLEIDGDAIAEAEKKSLMSYQENILKDVMRKLHSSTKRYIKAAFEARGTDGLIDIDEVNRLLPPTNASSYASMRTYALNTQVLRKYDRKRIRFALPHFEYALRPIDELDADPEAPQEEWMF